MDAIEVLQDGFSRIHSTLLSTLRGLTPEDLYYSPNIECNTIAWLAWHLTRVQDRHIADLAEHEQEWILGKWFEEFGQSPAPANVGFGHTPKQVQSFRLPNLDLMLAFLEAEADPNVRLTKQLWFTTFGDDYLRVDRTGATPFWRAAYALDVEAMKLLVAYGADPDVPTVKSPAPRSGPGPQST